VPPITSDDALAADGEAVRRQEPIAPPLNVSPYPAAPSQPPYPAQVVEPQPAVHPHPTYPLQPQLHQPYVAHSAPHAYPPQPYGYAVQPPTAQQHPYASPQIAQPHIAQPYPGQPVLGQPPAYGHAAPQSYQPQPYAPQPQPYVPAPGYGQVPPPVAAPQAPYYADGAQSLHPQQYGHPTHTGYAVQPGHLAPGYPTQPAAEPPAAPQAYITPTIHRADAPQTVATQSTERFTVQSPFASGYSEQPPRALLSSADDLGVKKSWQVSDDAPRYAPPGTAEADLDPFGLAALPEQAAYHGPKEVPSEAVYGLLFGLCSLLLFPLAFLGFARARRAGSMIDAAPSRFRGRLVVLLGFALNVSCPIMSVAAGAYLFGLI
jgi:hypothetical protein